MHRADAVVVRQLSAAHAPHTHMHEGTRKCDLDAKHDEWRRQHFITSISFSLQSPCLVTKTDRKQHLINGVPGSLVAINEDLVVFDENLPIGMLPLPPPVLQKCLGNRDDGSNKVCIPTPGTNEMGSSHRRRIKMERHAVTLAAISRYLKNMAIVFRTTFRVSSFKEGSIKTRAPAAGVKGTPTKSFG